jgi:hypothetical protein
LAQRPAASPSNPSGKVRKLRRREHRTPGRLALPHQSNGLLRPSVQLPAGSDEWRAYRGFSPLGKKKAAAAWFHIGSPQLDRIVCISYKLAMAEAAENVGSGISGGCICRAVRDLSSARPLDAFEGMLELPR